MTKLCIKILVKSEFPWYAVYTDAYIIVHCLHLTTSYHLSIHLSNSSKESMIESQAFSVTV